jgi:uncharacterized protein (DUF362 family)
MVRVSLVHGENRKENIKNAIGLLSKEIKATLENKDIILIKPNFVSTKIELAATNKDAVNGFLEFLKENDLLRNRKIIIAEGAALGETEDGFKNFGYYDLKKDYEIEFLDLNKTDSYKIEIFDKNLNLIKINCAKIMIKDLNKNIFYVSICPPKTHDTVIVTLSIKNIIVGSLQNDKEKIHQSIKAINLTLAKIYKDYIRPDLSIIDGFVGMEGDGPVDGEPVEMKIALAGLNPIYVDSLMTYLMGIDPLRVGYLYYLGIKKDFLEDLEIVGEDLEKYKRKFKLHRTANYQFKWRNI